MSTVASSGPASAATRRPVAILGGGVSGLAAAWHLAQRGVPVRLFERAAHLGGPVQSEAIAGGWLAESGPNSVQETPALATLLTALGLAGERVAASAVAKHRYLVRAGALVALPASPPGLLRSPLFSVGAKVKVFSELLRRRRPPRSSDLSLGALVRAHFGAEMVDTALDPMVSGIYAGHPEKLSARHAFPKLWEMEQQHGSLLRAQLAVARARRRAGGAAVPAIISLRDGLGSLPAALARGLPPGSIETGAQVEALFPGAPWRVVWRRGDDVPVTEECDRVVVTLPAAGLARLAIGALGERPLAALEAVEYGPVAALFLGYRREAVAHPLDGFGVLIPSRERRTALGVLFSSSLFPGRAPEGHVALTVMAGGVRRPDLVGLTADQLLAAVTPDLRELLGVRGEPVVLRHHAWPRAIPQYNLGYERFLDVMTQVEGQFPGLLLGGSVRDGISLPHCLASGARLAAAAMT